MNDRQTSLRREVLDIAARWIDTPYCHQASLRGQGADCLGLIRGVWRELYGQDLTDIPPYTPDWADSRDETLLMAARDHLTALPKAAAQPGDVLLFRMHPGVACKHIAVLSAPDEILHAYWGRAVVRSALVPYWTRRRAYSFSFPVSGDRI